MSLPWLFGKWSESDVFQSCLTLQAHGLQPIRFLLSWGFSRQKYWKRLLFPSPGSSWSRIEPGSQHWQPVLYHLSHRKPWVLGKIIVFFWDSGSCDQMFQLFLGKPNHLKFVFMRLFSGTVCGLCGLGLSHLQASSQSPEALELRDTLHFKM